MERPPPPERGNGRQDHQEDQEFKMRVFEADLDAGRWLEVDSLGDGEVDSRGAPPGGRALRLTGDDRRFQGTASNFWA